MRYLTLWALNADKSSLKSGYIRSRALQRVMFLCEFGNRRYPFPDGPALPVAILLDLHLLKARVSANVLVHAVVVTHSVTQRWDGCALPDGQAANPPARRRQEAPGWPRRAPSDR